MAHAALRVSSEQVETLQKAISAVKEAEFVALDMEFSGLFTSGHNHTTVAGLYEHCAENVHRFMTMQLGICTVRRSPEESNRWIFCPFNFYAFPSKRCQFLCDTSALSFLSSQGFDFNRWINEGFDYTTLALLQMLDEKKEQYRHHNKLIRENGLQSLVSALVESQKPIVLHNGFLDILHLHDKFIGSLPNTVQLFSQEVSRFFPGGIYDTKRIAECHRMDIFPFLASQRTPTTLSSLKFSLSSQPSKSIFVMDETLANSECGSYSFDEDVPAGILETRSSKSELTSEPVETISSVPAGSPSMVSACSPGTKSLPPKRGSKAHEAGYDAFLTAQVFLMELERISLAEWSKQFGEADDDRKCSSDSTMSRKKKRRLELDSFPGIPGLWREQQNIKSRMFELDVVGVAPGFINFAEQKRSSPKAEPARVINRHSDSGASPETAPGDFADRLGSRTPLDMDIEQRPLRSPSAQTEQIVGVNCDISKLTQPDTYPKVAVESKQRENVTESNLEAASGTDARPLDGSRHYSLPTRSFASHTYSSRPKFRNYQAVFYNETHNDSPTAASASPGPVKRRNSGESSLGDSAVRKQKKEFHQFQKHEATPPLATSAESLLSVSSNASQLRYGGRGNFNLYNFSSAASVGESADSEMELCPSFLERPPPLPKGSAPPLPTNQ